MAEKKDGSESNKVRFEEDWCSLVSNGESDQEKDRAEGPSLLQRAADAAMWKYINIVVNSVLGNIQDKHLPSVKLLMDMAQCLTKKDPTPADFESFARLLMKEYLEEVGKVQRYWKAEEHEARMTNSGQSPGIAQIRGLGLGVRIEGRESKFGASARPLSQKTAMEGGLFCGIADWQISGFWMGRTLAMRIGLRAGIWLTGLLLPVVMWAQTVPTTTVQGTVYLAGGAPGSGTVLVSWPAFTTAANQQVAAGSTVVTVGSDGFLSVNLAANLGSNPAGLYYTAVFHLSDGTVDTQYWVVPVAATATLASVQAQLMPAAVAVQSVSKAYVDQAIAELAGGLLTANGGTLTGPLVLAGDPTTPLMAADKHYVDEVFAEAVPSGGGTVLGPLMAPAVTGVYSPEAGTGLTTLQATQTAAAAAGGSMMVPPTYAGTDTFSNTAGVRVEDLRASGAQQHERSVKEFGAVCAGVTNDTGALQAAINFAQAALGSGHGIALTLPQRGFARRTSCCGIWNRSAGRGGRFRG